MVSVVTTEEKRLMGELRTTAEVYSKYNTLSKTQVYMCFIRAAYELLPKFSKEKSFKIGRLV